MFKVKFATGALGLAVVMGMTSCGSTDSSAETADATRTSPTAEAEASPSEIATSNPPSEASTPTDDPSLSAVQRAILGEDVPAEELEALESAPEAPDVSMCLFTTGEIETALGSWLAPGEVEIEVSGPEGCTYSIPEGSLNVEGGSGENLSLSGKPVMNLSVIPYSQNRISDRGVYGVTRQYGGNTPEQVYESAYIAQRDVGEATLHEDSPNRYPEIGGGLVTDNHSRFVMAGTGEHWYKLNFAGIAGGSALEPVLVDLAQVLATK